MDTNEIILELVKKDKLNEQGVETLIYQLRYHQIELMLMSINDNENRNRVCLCIGDNSNHSLSHALEKYIKNTIINIKYLKESKDSPNGYICNFNKQVEGGDKKQIGISFNQKDFIPLSHHSPSSQTAQLLDYIIKIKSENPLDNENTDWEYWTEELGVLPF